MSLLEITGLRTEIAARGNIIRPVDGVSLTVAAVRGGRFEIALIPETSARTTFGTKGPGDAVNLEIDPVARYALGAAAAYARGGDPAGEEESTSYEN